MKHQQFATVVVAATLASGALGCGDDSRDSLGPGRRAGASGNTAAIGVTVSRWTGKMPEGKFKYDRPDPGDGLKFDLHTNMVTDFTMSSVTVAPGGSVGWHSHTGPVFINIRAGTLTLLEYHDGVCERRDAGPGVTILEQGTGIHNGYNLGTSNVEYATAAWAPSGVPQRVDRPDPGCAP